MSYVTIDPANIWFLNGGAWFSLAVINAGLAEQKNRPRLVWFLLSCFIGPLATVLIVAGQKLPVNASEKLHPLSVAVDRYVVLACVFVVAGIILLVISLSNGFWLFWTLTGVSFALFLWMAILFWRAPPEMKE